MTLSNLKILSNNANGLQSSKKRIKMFEYYKSKIGPNGIIFIQETHSAENVTKEWLDDFNGRLFFSHGKTNSCGVIIGFFGTKKFEQKQIKRDKNGRILIVEANIDDETFILINIYNANTEQEQLQTLCELDLLLEDFSLDVSKNVIMAGDFNLFFVNSLEASGGSPTLKKKSIAKVIEITEKYNLCDIWRIRNPTSTRFTYRKNHFSGFIQRRLDYIFISNKLQESIHLTDILPAFSTDHSPVLISLKKSQDITLGKGFWKFNGSLVQDEDYVSQMKEYISQIKGELEGTQNTFNDQFKWEFLKYEIRKFTINFSKLKARKKRENKVALENKLKYLENNLENNINKDEYRNCKDELNKIYDNVAKGVKIRSKCNWYEHGEKSSKFFLNLEKSRAIQNLVRIIKCDSKELTDIKEINEHIFKFYLNLFKKKNYSSTNDLNTFLETVSLPSLTGEQKNICEGPLKEEELLKSLTNMENNKSPGNDGLTKEFYVTFWKDIKDSFIKSIKESKRVKMLTSSQRKAIIKLLEKGNKDKRFIYNWRPISLLNVDLKIISKALSERLKKVLPLLISPSQTAYVKNRFIGESGRLISDILDVSNIEKLGGYLLTIDIEKAFDSLDHTFLFNVLKKFGFGDDFVDWVKILYNNQESCVANGGHTTKYFKLGKRSASRGSNFSIPFCFSFGNFICAN